MSDQRLAAVALIVFASLARAEEPSLEAPSLLARLSRPASEIVGPEPTKCLTPHLAHAVRSGGELAAAAERFAAGDPAFKRVLFPSAGGHFEIDYETGGPNAVPPADLDSSGVPDYVEWVADAMEESWAASIDELGFEALTLGGGRYRVLLRAIGNIYGWATESATAVGGSTITLNSDFVGFYQRLPNLIGEDPDGKVRGGIRVTAAHEFKHALQFHSGGWESPASSLFWPELDATWIEDVVYDQVNDYYNYIRQNGSPFTEPQLSLLNASYEDAPWQLFLSERYGTAHVVALAELRAAQPSLNAQTAYRTNAVGLGQDWPTLWGEYAVWCYLVGTRARPGLGFGEAARYPTSPVLTTFATLPFDSPTRVIQPWANHFHEIDLGAAGARGKPEFSFRGDANAEWGVSLVLQGASPRVLPVPVTAGNGSLLALDVELGDFDRLAVVVGNGRVASSPSSTNSYSFSIAGKDTTIVGPVAAFRLGTPETNLVSGLTTVAFSIPADGTVSAELIDLRGRRVRQVLREARPEGEQDPIVLDPSGLASGAYLLRVEFGGRVLTRPVVLFK